MHKHHNGACFLASIEKLSFTEAVVRVGYVGVGRKELEKFLKIRGHYIRQMILL